MGGKRGNRPITTEQERGTTVADTKVRTTMLPGEVIEVDERELIDLERQHLILSREGDEGWQDAEPIDTDSGVITDGLDEQAATGDEQRLDDLQADTSQATASPATVAAPLKASKTKGA